MLYMIVRVCSFLFYDFILCQKWRNKTVQSLKVADEKSRNIYKYDYCYFTNDHNTIIHFVDLASLWFDLVHCVDIKLLLSLLLYYLRSPENDVRQWEMTYIWHAWRLISLGDTVFTRFKLIDGKRVQVCELQQVYMYFEKLPFIY